MAKAIRRSGERRVALSEIKGDLSRFLREAENEKVVIARNGKPAGVRIAFGSEHEWLDYQLEETCASAPRRTRAVACGRDSASEARTSSKKASSKLSP
jgi:PHD/YefM family antitoxin component YafN of YafNO toxin-antitoxin module